VAARLAQPSLTLMQKGLINGHKDDEVVWEYRRLFIGPFPKPAPPWGSVYTDHEGVIFGETALALRRWLREHAIERESDIDTPDDHIGLMLVLMAWLAEHRPDLLEEFLREHFLTWSSHFLDQLINAAEQPFYKGLAQLTKDSLEGLQESMQLEIAHPKFYR